MHLLVDAMCGRLVPYLRMCGYDTLYALDRGLEDDDALLAVAGAEGRTIVTRDVLLASRADAAILLESRELEGQLSSLREAGLALELADEPAFCGRCNGSLKRVAPATSTPEDAPDPAETRCWRCEECGQLFWKGSHWERVGETLARLESEKSSGESTGGDQ